MTVVLAVRCNDGLVIGADSQVTEDLRGMTYPAQKLQPIGEHAAWGGAGARSALLDIGAAFRHHADEILDAPDPGRAMQQRALPVLRYHYEHFIPEVPGAESAGTLATYVLAAGYGRHGPWIVEINPNAMISRYETIGFHAIGSAAPMAYQAGVLLSHFRMIERSVAYGVAAVVRVLDTLTLTSPKVGGPIGVRRITPDGVHELTDDETDDARRRVRRWEELESKALDDLFS